MLCIFSVESTSLWGKVCKLWIECHVHKKAPKRSALWNITFAVAVDVLFVVSQKQMRLKLVGLAFDHKTGVEEIHDIRVFFLKNNNTLLGLMYELPLQTVGTSRQFPALLIQ